MNESQVPYEALIKERALRAAEDKRGSLVHEPFIRSNPPVVEPSITQLRTNLNMSKNVKVIFGSATLGNIGKYTSGSPESENKNTGQEVLDILTKHNVKDLDTAYIYVRPGCSPLCSPLSLDSWLMHNRMAVKRPLER